MYIKNINDIVDKSDFSIMLISKNHEIRYIAVTEGCGDNLTQEDMDNGYVDYINFDEYVIKDNNIANGDSGMELLDQSYNNFSEQAIIEKVCCAVDAPDDTEIVCLPYEANAEFFEDALGIDMNHFDYDSHDNSLLDIYNQIISISEEYAAAQE